LKPGESPRPQIAEKITAIVHVRRTEMMGQRFTIHRQRQLFVPLITNRMSAPSGGPMSDRGSLGISEKQVSQRGFIRSMVRSASTTFEGSSSRRV